MRVAEGYSCWRGVQGAGFSSNMTYGYIRALHQRGQWDHLTWLAYQHADKNEGGTGNTATKSRGAIAPTH